MIDQTSIEATEAGNEWVTQKDSYLWGVPLLLDDIPECSD